MDSESGCGVSGSTSRKPAMSLEADFTSHEKVCAERYEQINARLKRLEGVIMKTAGVLIFSMSAIVYASLTLHR
jgi:hypothetical protein